MTDLAISFQVRAGQEEWGTPTVWLDKEYFVLSADVLTVLDRAVHEPIPAYKDDKGSGTPHRVKVRFQEFDFSSLRECPQRLCECKGSTNWLGTKGYQGALWISRMGNAADACQEPHSANLFFLGLLCVVPRF